MQSKTNDERPHGGKTSRERELEGGGQPEEITREARCGAFQRDTER